MEITASLKGSYHWDMYWHCPDIQYQEEEQREEILGQGCLPWSSGLWAASSQPLETLLVQTQVIFATLELPLLIFGHESLPLHALVTTWWQHLSRAEATSAALTLWCGFRGFHYLCCQTISALLSPQLVYKPSTSLRDMVCSKRMQRCKWRLRKHRDKKKRRINYALIKQRACSYTKRWSLALLIEDWRHL